MAIELVTVSKNTRGANSRKIEYKAIGKWVGREVARESKPVFDEDGNPVLDPKTGEQKRENLGKDSEGKLITQTEIVHDFMTKGVLTDLKDAMELVENNKQELLDCFAEGFNDRQYRKEADKDELDELLAGMDMTPEQTGAIKRAIRSLAKAWEVEIPEAVEMFKSMGEARRAKLAAAETANA